MSILFKNISQGFASLGNFFGETGPSLPKAPRNRGEAWQRDWRKIGSDFQSAEVKLRLVDNKTPELVGNLNAQLHIEQLRLLTAKTELKKIREGAKQDSKGSKIFWFSLLLIIPMIWTLTYFLILFAIPPLKDYLEIEFTVPWFLNTTFLIFINMIVFSVILRWKCMILFIKSIIGRVRADMAVKDKSSPNEK
ncbi:MAG: hypothetical protein ORO03_04015 [Alphaproteobacteria bacterium]|nr:hypothetical protein [Alphaproteobacteria bacterium]